MEDADSVLVTGHQYRTSNCYMVSFIGEKSNALPPCHHHTLHGMGAALFMILPFRV